MTSTEKILAEFDREFVKDCGPDVEPIFIDAVGSVGPIRQFLATSITQAMAEEREMVREKANKLRKDHSFKVHEVGDIAKEAYNQALDDLLSFLNY